MHSARKPRKDQHGFNYVGFFFLSKSCFVIVISEVCASRAGSLSPFPSFAFQASLHASQQSGIWHITCQPPTGIFAEPTVHIEPNHTSCKRFTIPLSSSGQKSGSRWRRRRRTHLMVGKRAEGNGNKGITKSWGRWSSYSSALIPLPDT